MLEKQRLSDNTTWTSMSADQADEGEVDTTLTHIGSQRNGLGSSKKGKVEQIEWDHELEAMSREKASADATRGMGTSFLSSHTLIIPLLKSSSHDCGPRCLG